MFQVPVRLLREYLLQKQEEGYSLVGAEQTTNSVCLTQHRFPRKTLLLLGCVLSVALVKFVDCKSVCSVFANF